MLRRILQKVDKEFQETLDTTKQNEEDLKTKAELIELKEKAGLLMDGID